jgi:hypothetical protein|tara:strand:+ start:252 stop:434 length:183 start_codon:yes stop_codon:yes gene_type:complete
LRAGRFADGFFPARKFAQKLGDLVLKTAEEVGRYPAAIEIVTIMPEELNKIATLATQGVP